jgi:UDP-2,3-diacylglucosamine hydrolase
MPAGTLPEIRELRAPAHWRVIDLISDLHLAASMPRTAEVFAGHLLNTSADAVFILGDLFELFIGDDTRTRPFEARYVSVLRAASRQRFVGFMAGNRDFLVGAATLADGGAQRLHDPTLLHAFGQRWLLTHGDELCLADVDYQMFRREVRSPEWQADFLARPIDERERLAQAIRTESQARKDGSAGVVVWADVDAAAAVDWLRACDATQMIHGHTHRPGTSLLAPGFQRHVLSDWDLDHADHPARAEVLRLDAHGVHRLPPTCAH